ncbi:hypothetical protein Tco_1336882 [Tanacetum coccineum]
MVPRAVLMNSGLVSLNTARQVNTAHPKITMNSAKPTTNLSKSVHSTVKWSIHKNTTFKNSNFNQRVNTIKDKNFNIARPKEVVNAARPKVVVNVVKGNNVNAGNLQIDLQDKGVIDSGCSRHMTGNMSYLTDYEEIDGGYVAFGGNPKGGKITGRANPASSKEVIDIDVQTEEDADLMVASSTSLTEATRKAAASKKIAKKKTHSPKQPSSTPISKSADDIMTFRKELDALALKHLGPVPATECSPHKKILRLIAIVRRVTYKHTKEAIIKLKLNIVFLLAFYLNLNPRKVSEALDDEAGLKLCRRYFAVKLKTGYTSLQKGTCFSGREKRKENKLTPLEAAKTLSPRKIILGAEPITMLTVMLGENKGQRRRGKLLRLSENSKEDKWIRSLQEEASLAKRSNKIGFPYKDTRRPRANSFGCLLAQRTAEPMQSYQRACLEVNFKEKTLLRKKGWTLRSRKKLLWSWKLNQLRKLSFEEVKEEFDKLYKKNGHFQLQKVSEATKIA